MTGKPRTRGGGAARKVTGGTLFVCGIGLPGPAGPPPVYAREIREGGIRRISAEPLNSGP
jgi:hypothetical protein